MRRGNPRGGGGIRRAREPIVLAIALAATIAAAPWLVSPASARSPSRPATQSPRPAYPEPPPPDPDPLPPPRPADLPQTGPANGLAKPAAPTQTPAPNRPQPVLPAELNGADCLARLKQAGIDVEAAEHKPDNPACAIDTPVRLLSAPSSAANGGRVLFPARPLMACRFALALGDWSGRLVAPTFAGAQLTLTAIDTGPGYDCRPRNHVAGAKMSAHGTGTAIDIAGLQFERAPALRFGPTMHPLLQGVRVAACGWFTTVLGPGSDAAHGDHLHLDIERHGSSDRYRICQ